MQFDDFGKILMVSDFKNINCRTSAKPKQLVTNFLAASWRQTC
jgi:hypothetical protein